MKPGWSAAGGPTGVEWWAIAVAAVIALIGPILMVLELPRLPPVWFLVGSALLLITVLVLVLLRIVQRHRRASSQ